MTGPKTRRVLEPFQLVDEGLHLLRTTPFGDGLATYYIGALPFVAALVFFVSDLSRAADAWRYCPEAAAGLAAAFLWLKWWQARFCAQLWRQVAGEPPLAWTWREALVVLGRQARCQPLVLLVHPLGVVLLPAGPLVLALLVQSDSPGLALAALLAVLLLALFVAGFAQALTVYTGLPASAGGTPLRRAFRCARLEFGALASVQLFLLLFLGVVLLNVVPVLLVAPLFLKHVLGVELAVLKLDVSALATVTTATVVLSLAWLVADPVAKAVHVLACFYHEAAGTGADLRAELKALKLAGRSGPLLLLATAVWLAPPGGWAAQTATDAAPAVAAPALRQAIDDTLRQRRYTWRLPAEVEPVRGGEFTIVEALGREALAVFKRVGRWLGESIEGVGAWLRELVEKLLPKGPPKPPTPGPSWRWLNDLGPVCAKLFQVLLVALVAAGVGLLAYRLWRWHGNRRPAESPGLDSPAAVKPDLEDEAVAADALPEDRWTQLAREQAAAGNLRLALRALYLGTLAHLGQRQLIVIARAKSNREYQRELERRAHALPQVLEGFAHNVGIFENVWYGLYPVDEPLVQRFQANVERIRRSEPGRSA